MGIPKPNGLGEHGGALWDEIVQRPDAQRDGGLRVLLLLACRWLDKAYERMDEKSMVASGIATDKFLLLMPQIGLTAAHRKALGIEGEGAEKAKPKKRTSLDSLTPEQLGLKPKAGQ